MAVLIVVWLALSFVWFSSCGLGLTVLSITCLFVLFFYVVAFLPFCCDVNVFRPNASIFVVGFSMLYAVFLTWSALASQDDLECNELLDSGTNTFLQILIGSLFTFINVWSIAVASADQSAKGDKHTMGQAIIEE